MKANSERIIELFSEAMAMSSPDERARFLDSACQNEPEVREQVESLLRAGEPAADFLKQPPPGPERLDDLLTEKPGDVFGPYKLLQQIGEGGFGVVWMAEQSQPILRKVALKVVKAGMDTKQVLARFEAERQALAMMDHPNIARVLDAGATPTGRPYFAMELVKGIPITEFCDQQKLDTRQRLELFCDVCSAVNHAHQKGVIHRDLKPSNVMVTLNGDQGVAKVIDFGIAKATEQKLTDKTLFTRFEQFLGTPVYMSPEQAAMSATDIDTRSDIYSLGMLLYELLAGRPAFDSKTLLSAGYDEMRRIIKEDEPPKPSVRLTQRLTHGVPASAGAPPPEDGTPDIPDDLDWIVMKAIEKDRSRRYETANALSADLQRHLSNEPVTARPSSTAYRLQKAFRRNKLAFSAAAAIAVILILGAIVSTWLALEASKATDTAMEQRLRAERGELAARTSELKARQVAYASDMKLAHQFVQENDFSRALELLNRQGPRAWEIPNPKSQIRNKSEIRNPKSETATSEISSTLDSQLSTDLRGWEWRYLWTQCHPREERFILGEHIGGASVVGMLGDGKTVFSAGKDKVIRLWDLESRRQVGTLPHTEEIIGAAASPDGRWLATATKKEAEGRPILLWDLATREIADRFTTETADFTNFWLRPGSITFSPDSKWLAFGTVWGGVRLWDVNARSEVANLPATDDGGTEILGFAFSPDSRTLAYTENELGAILLWDLARGEEIGRLTGHQSAVTALAFSPDGQKLASSSKDNTTRLWSPAERREISKPTHQSSWSSSLAFSPDSQTLAMIPGGGVIRLIDVETGNQKAERRGHLKPISSLAFADGQTLLSASWDGSLRVWDVVPRVTEKSFHLFDRSSISTEWNSYGPALCLSPDGRHLLAVYTDQTFGMWDTLHFTEGERHPLPFPETGIAAVAVGGRLAAFGSRSGEVMLWDAETSQPRRVVRPGTDQIHRLVFSLDGRSLAAADNPKIRAQKSVTTQDTTIRVWDVETLRESETLREPQVFSTHGEFAVSLAFSADATALVAGCWRGPVKLWPLGGAGQAATFVGHAGGADGLALLPDGHTLISAAGSIRFWDVRTRSTTDKINPRTDRFLGLALSPDGRRLAAGDSDGRITIWDVASHQEVATLEGHDEEVMHLAFTPDGDRLVSVSKDQFRVWRAASWAETHAVTGPQDAGDPNPK